MTEFSAWMAIRVECRGNRRPVKSRRILNKMLIIFITIIIIIYGTPSHGSLECLRRHKDTFILSHTTNTCNYWLRRHKDTFILSHTTNTCNYWWRASRMRTNKWRISVHYCTVSYISSYTTMLVIVLTHPTISYLQSEVSIFWTCITFLFNL